MRLHSLVELVGSQNIVVTVDGLVMGVFCDVLSAKAVAVAFVAVAVTVAFVLHCTFVVGKSSGEVLGLMLVLVVGVVGNNSGVFVMDGTRVGLLLELDVGLLLVGIGVMGVVVSRDLVVDGVVVDNMRGIVLVLVMSGEVLNVVVRVLMVVLVMSEFTVVVSVDVLSMVGLLVVGSVVTVLGVKRLVGGVVAVSVVLREFTLVVDGFLVMSSSGSVLGVVVVVVSLVSRVRVIIDGGNDVRSVFPDGVTSRFLFLIVGGVVATSVGGEVVKRDVVLHLASKEDLGESETDGVTIFVEVLVLPLGLSVHDFVMDILAVHDEVVIDVEDEVPRVSEGLGHLSELVKVGTDGGLALFELVGDIMDNMSEILNGVKHRVERTVLELVDDATEALPDVLGITEALDTVGNLSLD